MLFVSSSAFSLSGNITLARPYSSSTSIFRTQAHGTERLGFETIEYEGMT